MSAATDSTPAPCPKCGYQRRPVDDAPHWQCPACGIAIEKFRAQEMRGRAMQASMVEVQPSTVPRPSFARRAASAFPDALTAGVFLWCWIAPSAWRPTLAQELGQLMFMQFFVMHSSGVLAGMATAGDQSLSVRLGAGLLVMVFYLPIAGAFAMYHGAWWPFLGFVWLLTGRLVSLLAGTGPDNYERKRQWYFWGAAAGWYVYAAFVAVFLPMPELGFAHTGLRLPGWLIGAPSIMAWGALSFGAVACMQLLEDPQRIEDLYREYQG